MEPTDIPAERLERLERLRLFHGSHNAPSAQEADLKACAMEMVSYIAGEPWSDHPQCACPVLTSFVISLNDNWADADRQRLKPFLPKLIGTRSTAAVETRRAVAALDWTMRIHRPIWLEAAGMAEHAAKLRALPEIVDEATFKPALVAQEAAVAAARAAWDARAAWAAWDARAAWAARAAWDAWDARAAVAGLVAFNAGASLGPDASEEKRTEAGIAALESVAVEVRASELELLDRMIASA